MSLFNRKRETQLETLLENTARLYDELRGEYEEAQARIDDLEGQVRELDTVLENAGIDDLRYDIDRTDDKIGDLDTRISDLESEPGDVELAELIERVGVSDKSASLSDRVDSIDVVLQKIVDTLFTDAEADLT